MRIFATSDLHVDYRENGRWVSDLSTTDFTDDVLILAGDISDSLERIERTLTALAARFKRVLYVPGNHDLWVLRDKGISDSFEKFGFVRDVINNSGATSEPFHGAKTSIIPLLGWYDFSFGEPSDELKRRWMDFRACRWPDDARNSDVTAHFIKMNEPVPDRSRPFVITFSHFMPRIDLIPSFAPPKSRMLLPILGTGLIDEQIRRAGASLHVYGHSHVNRRAVRDGVVYINNAFGYPSEGRFTAKKLLCIHEE
ncbi:metallophosphoesterase [Hoeflea prorocentri]|uniref:Metallophosphoesterase n=1 Tax=Hoeflea prorocentri TaxID=1922333 RepID=A0A9X3UIH7_9HYPH|nr:metallophosphoesterase [Hoeflea prorocentri]MCY6381221.1 metallophosphoesterase [Hoeflea prorocentri]MDA5399021.1 metallophosphoesterase [Hoeflea prorocentri]